MKKESMNPPKQIVAAIILLTGTLFAQTNLTFPDGTNLPNAKFVSGQTRITATGNTDLYTVPANRRALVVNMQTYNDSPNTLTFLTEAKIGGGYYTIGGGFSQISAGPSGGARGSFPNIFGGGPNPVAKIKLKTGKLLTVIY